MARRPPCVGARDGGMRLELMLEIRQGWLRRHSEQGHNETSSRTKGPSEDFKWLVT